MWGKVVAAIAIFKIRKDRYVFKKTKFEKNPKNGLNTVTCQWKELMVTDFVPLFSAALSNCRKVNSRGHGAICKWKGAKLSFLNVESREQLLVEVEDPGCTSV